MDFDTGRVRELLDARDKIDDELTLIFNGGKKREPQKCSACGSESHNARNCPTKVADKTKPPATPPKP